MKKRIRLLLLLALTATAGAAETPEGILKRARQLDEQGKASRAAKLYRAFLKNHPNHTQVLNAHYRLAKCLDSLGWVDESIQHLETVIKARDKRYRQRQDAFYMLGKLHASMKHYKRGAEVFERMLLEGAGLYEDEVLSLCGGYYGVLKRYDEAAAKFNLLKRRKGSRFAEQAAYKLAVLWLRAENLEFAVEAVQDLALRFPRNKQARGLMLQIADLFRKQRKFRKAAAACEQLRSRFPKSREAQASGYVLGLCYRDRKQFDKAAKTLEAVARVPAHRKTGLAAEALLQAADIYYGELAQPKKAMQRYEETAKIVRESTGERRTQILEQCYFRLAEHNFGQKRWNVALEYYLLLRKLGTRLNVLPRILKCQAEVDVGQDTGVGTESDIEMIEKKIKENPGTFIAAEGEVFLTDLELSKALNRKAGLYDIVAKYKGVLKKYSKDVLAQDSLESYVYTQLGLCYGRGETKLAQRRAIACLEKALAVDPKTPYKTEILENMARVADAGGDKQKAFEVYQRLFAMSAQRVASGEGGEPESQRMAEYLRGILSRAEQKDSIEEALAIARRITQKRGPFSEAARHALFYMGDLYYLKKDFSTAAKAYRQFIKAYGPRQNPKGEVIGAPWKPQGIDERVRQVHEASARVAHCWYMQGHTQNMVKAYEWLLANFSHQNKYVAEAHYWLALEMVKGKKGRSKENKRKMAEALWKNVVNPSFDLESRDLKRRFHFWVTDRQMQKYVKAAILKSGQASSGLGEHERAAGIFRQYLELYPELSRRRRDASTKPDPMYRTARYALGREYIALDNITKLIDCYKVYVDQMRECRFRVSALQLLGYHASRRGVSEAAIEAYATLLDEYGQNDRNAQGEIIPVPERDRTRRRRYRWDGVRMAPPKGLDLGQVRYALGFLYWKKENWGRCVKILTPFVVNPQLFENKSRPKALYMVARSYYHAHDYERGLKVLLKLLRDHPRFEAIEEAYVYAARGCAETRRWSEIPRLWKWLVRERPRSPNRPHMDLYAALATLGQGKAQEGVARLRSIANSDTYEDVKADAHYHLGTHFMSLEPPKYKTALDCLDKSLALYPRERSCLAAAKCCIELKNWKKAKALLERAIRDFPTGNRKTIEKAKRLLPEVLKQMAKQG